MCESGTCFLLWIKNTLTLRMFQSKVMVKIFGSKRYNVTKNSKKTVNGRLRICAYHLISIVLIEILTIAKIRVSHVSRKPLTRVRYSLWLAHFPVVCSLLLRHSVVAGSSLSGTSCSYIVDIKCSVITWIKIKLTLQILVRTDTRLTSFCSIDCVPMIKHRSPVSG